MRFMERILVVSSTEKTHAMLAQFLSSCGVQSQLCRAMAGSEARRALVDGEFDLVLVNTPLPDEFGHELAQLAAGETTAGVILLAKAECPAKIIVGCPAFFSCNQAKLLY